MEATDKSQSNVMCVHTINTIIRHFISDVSDRRRPDRIKWKLC